MRMRLQVCTLLALVLLCHLVTQVNAQARSLTSGKLRRRHGMITDVYGRPRKVKRRRPDDPRMPEYKFRRDITRPGNPLWRFGPMPGLSYGDRFRMHPSGHYYNHFRGY